jgi:hypothetical protein
MRLRFEVLTAVVMKISNFCQLMSCSPLKFKQRFGGRSKNKPIKKSTSSASYLLHAGCLLGLFFGPEEEGDMFLRIVG